jgi:drug/metabolite transporter (DMT)-like permease
VSSSSLRAVSATAAALVGFAANSLLCRAALGAGRIDAWSFTAVRLVAGALVLLLLAKPAARRAGSTTSALALWGYAAAFSLAYLRLGAGVGALVLFASVQATMLGWSALHGRRPGANAGLGLVLAFAGLVVLCRPGADLPDPGGLGLMTVAGVAWGAYSLRGSRGEAPLVATAGNFARAAPLALAAWAAALVLARPHADLRGLALAAASGALASGLGYCLWYLALPWLGAVRAALVQLLVPVLAAVAGVVLLGEPAGVRLLVAGPLVLGGVALAMVGRARA